MFLGNLSTATERSARKTTTVKQKLKTTNDFSINSSSLEIKTFLDDILFKDGIEVYNHLQSEIPIARRLSPADRIDSDGIIYSKDGNSDIPRELLIRYLKECAAMILYLPNIYEVIADSQNLDVGLHEAAVLYQQDVLEYNYHIERKFGCMYLSQIPLMFPSDEELQQAAQNYIYSAMRSYLIALNVRGKKGGVSGLSSTGERKLITSGEFKRVHMLEFFEACNSLNAMEEMKQVLRDLYRSTNKIPNEKVIECQRSMLELIGYKADYAVSRLNVIQQTYGSDMEIITKLQYFGVCAKVSCDEATMTDEQRKQFYDDIPPMMRHYPHLYVIQKQQEQIQKQQQRAMMQSNGLSSIFQSEEMMQKIKSFIIRMESAAKESVAKGIDKWTSTQREEFFDKFYQHPILDTMRIVGEDATSRITKLLELTDDDLGDIMTMQAVMAEDMKANGTIFKRIREAQAAMWAAAAKANKEGGVSSSTLDELSPVQKIGGLMASLGSLTNLGRSIDSSNHTGDHSHSGHNHSDPNHVCPIHPRRPVTQDVTSGKAEKMER